MENVKFISIYMHFNILLESDGTCEFESYSPGHNFINVEAPDLYSVGKELQ